MQRRRLLLIALLMVSVVSVTFVVYWYVQLQTVAKPSWLKLDSYMIYEQFFVWNEQNETEYMTWNATGMSGDFVDLHLVSHGVDVTGENVVITLGEADWTINAFTREIVSSSDASYVGKKWPFWIQTNVRVGSTVDIFYGVNKISKSESIDVLGQQRDCWVLEYNWATADMKRWYDKSSGLCLKIYVVLYRGDITITITETAVRTNIDLKY